MAQNRIQFQKSLSLNEFLDKYGTEDQCAAALEKMRWPDGYICPYCEGKSHCIVRHGKVKTFQCNRCHAQTTLTGGTIFHSTKMSLTTWFQAIYFLSQTKNNVSALELTRLLGICYRTAWRMKHKIMQVMHEREQMTILAGRIEIDDAYLGGERAGGTVGRGSENKVPFVAAVETNDQGYPKRAVFSPVITFNSAEIAEWACRTISASSTVISDGFACFRAVVASGCKHEPETIGKNRKSIDLPQFKWVNTILGNLKTAINGTYHGFDFAKYASRYLSEVQYRFNRRFDLRAMFSRLLLAGINTGKRTEAWLRVAEDYR